jgi:hypothetical protein
MREINNGTVHVRSPCWGGKGAARLIPAGPKVLSTMVTRCADGENQLRE